MSQTPVGLLGLLASAIPGRPFSPSTFTPASLMSLDKLNAALVADVAALKQEGRAKAPERIIVGYVPAAGARGPRYRLHGSDRDFLRMNSNSYLSLSNHPACSLRPTPLRTRSAPVPAPFASSTAPLRRTRRSRRVSPASSIGRRRVLQLGLYHGARPGHHSGRPRHLLDRRRAESQLHHPRDADRQRARRRSARSTSTTTSTISIATCGRCPTAPAGSSSSSTASSACAATTLRSMGLRQLVAQHEDRFRDGVVTVMDDSHGIAAYGAHRPRYRRALRRAGRHLRRHVRQGVWRQRRLRRGQRRTRSRRCGRRPTPTSTRTRSARPTAPPRSRPLTSPTAPKAGPPRQPPGADDCSSVAASSRSDSSPFPVPTRSCRCSCATPNRVRAMVAGLFERGILAVGLTFPSYRRATRRSASRSTPRTPKTISASSRGARVRCKSPRSG